MNRIRLAQTSDAAAILKIYEPFITDSAITFETEIPSLSSFAQRIQTYLETWPWLVYEVDGMVAGYVYAARHRERAAYQWCVESSVYVHHDFQKRGIAKTLYDVLFKILKHQGFINVYAGITWPNEKSVAFHESYGFQKLGEYKNIGYKLGKWHTVGWWELQLNDYTNNPSEPIKFPSINNSFLKNIFEAI